MYNDVHCVQQTQFTSWNTTLVTFHMKPQSFSIDAINTTNNTFVWNNIMVLRLWECITLLLMQFQQIKVWKLFGTVARVMTRNVIEELAFIAKDKLTLLAFLGNFMDHLNMPLQVLFRCKLFFAHSTFEIKVLLFSTCLFMALQIKDDPHRLSTSLTVVFILIENRMQEFTHCMLYF